MLEENWAPGEGVVHRRHRQRIRNDTPPNGIPTYHSHAASADDVSISSDDSKKMRYNERIRLGRMSPSKGTLIFLAVLIIGSSIAALIFLDGSTLTDHGGGGGYGSSLRGRGVQLAKEVGNRLEKHRRNFQEARGAREGADKKQRVKNHDGSAMDASDIGGALDYAAANQPLTASRGSRPANRALDESETPVSRDGGPRIIEREQDGGENLTDEGAASHVNVEGEKSAAAVTGEPPGASGDDEEEEEEEKREESEHYWVTNYTYVDVYNTSLPENKHLAADLSMESPSTVAHNMVERISSSVSLSIVLVS